MIHRSYLKSQATLIRNSYTNNSRNPIIELTYAGGQNSATTKISRYVFKYDLTDLIEKIDNNEIKQQNIQSHKITFTNCINLSDEYVGKNFLNLKRASGFDLVLIALTEDFDEGTGYDYIYKDSLYREIELNKSSANWFYRKNPQISWFNNGIFSGDTSTLVYTSTTAQTPYILASQRFELGNENIEFDVTNYINDILYSGNTNYGFCLCFSANTENLTSDYQYVISYFSKYTQTFFKPFLETKYDNSIIDERCEFFYNQNETLYLITPFQIDSVDNLEIINSSNQVISSITSFTTVNNFTYSATINLPEGNLSFEQYSDKWTYTYNGVQKTHTNKFNIKKISFDDFSNIESTKVFININGIKQNDIISNTVKTKKIIFKPKRFVKNMVYNNLIGSIKFRIFIKQGKNEIEIIPFTNTNKIDNQFYTNIDFSWFVPHDYYIEVIALDNNGITYPESNIINFRIVS
jgi:hypothetical protein